MNLGHLFDELRWEGGREGGREGRRREGGKEGGREGGREGGKTLFSLGSLYWLPDIYHVYGLLGRDVIIN